MKCQRCNVNEGTEELHPCPYAQEIHDDYETCCNCCPDCENECCMDI